MRPAKLKKTCGNCLKGKSIPINSDVFCSVKGMVSSDYVCSRHKLTSSSKSIKEMGYKCIDCENFILEVNGLKDKPAMGLCQLFSIRQFDGKQKNTCSKFIKKSAREVS